MVAYRLITLNIKTGSGRLTDVFYYTKLVLHLLKRFINQGCLCRLFSINVECIAFAARRSAWRGICDGDMSVCLCVCHVGVL